MNNRAVKRIEIIGCMASGKTTLCQTLQKFGWNSIYEPYEHNPFLTSFYNGEKCAFELQMCFLLQHFNEFNSNNQINTYSVCDFSFYLDSIYASLLLSDNELIIYNELLKYIMSQTEPPEYIIKLTCPSEVLLDRINTRNRSFERTINKKFVEELNVRIDNYTIDCKYIQVDSYQTNLFSENEVYDKIVKYIV